MPDAPNPISTSTPQDSPIWQGRPAWPFIFTQHRWLLIAALLALAIIPINRKTPLTQEKWLLLVAGVAGLLWLLAAVASWLSRRYTLTPDRLRVSYGVLHRIEGDLPLNHLIHATLDRPLLQRLLGLGTLHLASRASNEPAITLRMIPRPNEVLQTIQHAAEQSTSKTRDADPMPRDQPSPRAPTSIAPPRFVTLGLAGGIGAGKSEVARILASLGYIVVDSDRQAKAALDRPEVRDQLVSWWGPGIIGPDARVSRSAIANRIFTNPSERRRLESLIHPLIAVERDAIKAKAMSVGAPGLVIDAPLLFEAALNRQCDHVLFVDAPREQRLARVKSTRGWDEAELARREASQWPLEQKRAESSIIITNDADPATLESRVRDALRSLSLLTNPRPKPPTSK